MTWLPVEAWLACTAPVTSGTAYRAPAILDDIVDQFDVVHHPRYQAHDGKTYCNVFVADVTRALGAEVPHWEQGRELRANDLVGWLSVLGPRHGWREVKPDEARNEADAGRPVVVTWWNPSGGPGHIAVGVPSRGVVGLQIAQAGSTNFARGPVAAGFGTYPVRYWSHP